MNITAMGGISLVVNEENMNDVLTLIGADDGNSTQDKQLPRSNT